MKEILSGLGVLLLVGGLLLVLLFVFQRKLIYPAPPGGLPSALPADVQKLDFNGGYLLYLPAIGGDEKTPVILFSHGNGELAWQWMGEFQTLREAGIAVALVEFPGYGGAPGKPSLDSIREVMLGAYDLVTAREDVDSRRVIAYGRSIGGGAACLLVESRAIAAVVLESTFSHLATLVREMYYPSALLLDRYDNVGILSNTEVPVFLYHGTHDRVIPVSHAQTLKSATKNATLEIADCDHNSCPRPEQQVLEFLRNSKVL